MYYAEKFENGKAWCQHEPNGPWVEIPPDAVWRRYQQAQDRANINWRHKGELLQAAEALLAVDAMTPGRDGEGFPEYQDLIDHHNRWSEARDALHAIVAKVRGKP